MHLPAWGVPPGVPVPTVATFYDATPFRLPSPPERWRRWRARRATRSLVRANAIHAISHHAERELLGATAVRAEKVSVVYLGVDPVFSPAIEPDRPRHLLFVGGGDPHKNLDVLLAVLTDAPDGVLPPLVVAGPASTDPRLRSPALARLVRPVPHPTDLELATLYRQAVALLVPSRNEGFGLPALEAMACACPVIAARAGALPEVCGDAATFVDPDDRRGWLDAVAALVASSELRSALAEAGLARAASFTWQRTAGAMLDLYRRFARAESS
jgi:glycosyltransferase involved in cell wall biosynthesis